MSGELEFYFDFVSPFAYLAHDRVCALARRYGRKLTYLPIDLPAAKIAAGNTGPSNREIPAKLRYLMTDIDRWAKRVNLPVSFPASLASYRMNAGTFYALDRGLGEKYVREAFNLGWGLGGDIGSDETLTRLAETMGWPPAEFIEYTGASKALPEYVASNRQAVEKGVFGVPTIIVDDQMWWGNDRLDFVGEYLAGRGG
ncbi:MAG: 2-hydroxychromene-2-carboxylate isomerase [Gammaproteobacteria bacterium]|nr:2-hydroxychromene-2-carboxylate isomerase [Gammaproteobacteria bacterium]